MRSAKILAIALAAAGLSACTTMNMNVKDAQPEFPEIHPFDWYFNTDGMTEYDGDIVDLSFLGTGARQGELVHVSIWPFVGVGVGAAGFRAQILPLDFGLGTILYKPSAATGGGE